MSSVQFLASHKLPIELGTLSIDADGTMRRRPLGPLRFTWEYAGLTFAGDIEPIDRGVELRLGADVGPMPYSADGFARRVNVQTIMNASHAARGQVHFSVDPHQRIWLRGTARLNAPLTPLTVIQAATEFLINASPWLDLLRRHAARVETIGGKGSRFQA